MKFTKVFAMIYLFHVLRVCMCILELRILKMLISLNLMLLKNIFLRNYTAPKVSARISLKFATVRRCVRSKSERLNYYPGNLCHRLYHYRALELRVSNKEYLCSMHLRMAEQDNGIQQAHYRARLRPPAERSSAYYRVESSQLFRRSRHMG